MALEAADYPLIVEPLSEEKGGGRSDGETPEGRKPSPTRETRSSHGSKRLTTPRSGGAEAVAPSRARELTGRRSKKING